MCFVKLSSVDETIFSILSWCISPRSSRKVDSPKQPPEVFCRKSVLKNFAKFTGKHLCWSLFKKNCRREVRFLRTPLLQNTSGRLLLYLRNFAMPQKSNGALTDIFPLYELTAPIHRNCVWGNLVQLNKNNAFLLLFMRERLYHTKTMSFRLISSLHMKDLSNCSPLPKLYFLF